MTTTFRAPGRVNLIGEHTDYNEGFVLPAAIGFHTTVTVTPSQKLELYTASNAPEGWEIYVLGVYEQLLKHGIEVPPARLDFSSTLPMGAGLSSSAALEVSSALAFLSLAETRLQRMNIARLCQLAEIENVGLRCGIMDQFISLHGQADHAVLLDCRNFDFKAVPIPEGIVFVIANTMIKHQLADGEYNLRREECEIAATDLGVSSLRDATSWGDNKRARHIVTENQRVLSFVEALESGDLASLGELMASSHASLRGDFEVSCPELDIMVEEAQTCPGLIGARMTGGGFGGSTINLVHADQAEAFRAELARRYYAKTGINPSLLITRAADSAS
ncbi:galactokinase [Bryobacter aggregatus]|uniref:galactokinase n=1 Tax=Bryobacter aggregatus TaxID=360054 RepID=UPI00068F0523|nr:galactokinase [Bryobacter aggregatus]